MRARESNQAARTVWRCPTGGRGARRVRRAAAAFPAGRLARVRAVSAAQRYRMRATESGREIIREAEPGRVYVDRETGEPLEIVGKVLPLAPSKSRLPWAVENLRFCPWCDQLAQRDLNDCPHCGRRMDPVT